MLNLAYVGGLGMMAGPASVHLTPPTSARVLRFHDRGTPGEHRDGFRAAWREHGAVGVATMDELVGVGDLDGVVVCAGKNGDDLLIIRELTRLLAERSKARPFILHLSTVSPRFAEVATGYCGSLNVDYANYPLTGGPLGARLGGADPKGMLILASGSQELYQRVEPVLKRLGHPRYFGVSPSAGSITKLIGHHLVFNGLNGIASATALHAENFNQGNLGGESQVEYLSFLNGGAGGTRQWEVGMHKGVADGVWDQGFSVVHAVVDAIYAARLALESGLPRISVQAMIHTALGFSFLYKKYPDHRFATHAIVREMVAANARALDEFMHENGAFGDDMRVAIDAALGSLPERIQASALLDISMDDFTR